MHNFRPWPEGPDKTLAALGGQDTLKLMIGARSFRFDQYNEGEDLHVKRARFIYRDRKGRLRQLKIIESSMHDIGPQFSHMVLIDTQPCGFTLEWLLWVAKPKGDTDSDKHRHWHHVGDLNSAQQVLRQAVEKVTGMVLNFD